MFGSLSGWELVFIFALALLLFGPRQLPRIGRTIGRTLSELRKATHEFKGSLEREIEVEEMKGVGKELTAATRDAKGAVRDLTRVARDRLSGSPTAPTAPPAETGAPPASSVAEPEAPEPAPSNAGTREEP